MNGAPDLAEAAAYLISRGLVEIRSRVAEAVREAGDDRTVTVDMFMLERIYQIAEVCHELSGPLALPDPQARTQAAAEALAERWSTVPAPWREWIARRLEELGPDYLEAIDT
jgi:hypothetical protein